MPVSSLVFVVIVAIWAAYLVQHWARRREDAAATRSMEGLSEAMRVLEKRPALRAPELSTPRAPSYAVRPASIGPTVVDVKRAIPAGASRHGSPLVARRAQVQMPAARNARPASDPARHDGHSNTHHDIAPDAEMDLMPHTASAPMAQRRLRAALLLLSLLWLPVSIVLTVTGVLMWVSIPFAVLTIGAVLVWLRAEARADRLRAGSQSQFESYPRHVAREHGLRDGRDGRSRRQGARGARRVVDEPVLTCEDTQVIHSSVVGAESRPTSVSHPAATGDQAAMMAPAQPASSARAASVRPAVFDVQALDAAEAATAASTARRTQPAQPVADGSWSPVPVPRPTYALKAKAEPRWTDSGIPADVFDTPEFAEEADELDDRALFARRAVSQ